MLLIFILTEIALGGYVPIPAPTPMLDHVTYRGKVVTGSFDIEDPNGPEGITIMVTPSNAGLVIGEPTITVIEGFPDARKYVFPWTFTATKTGRQSFEIKSEDTMNVVVNQKMDFNVKGNEPQVFTGCRVLQ